MPELPEVETVRTQLGPLLNGQYVAEAWAFPSDKFTPATDVVGIRFGPARRRGKYLILPTDDGRELIVHLGMTGSLRLAGPDDVDERYLRAWWRLRGQPSGANEPGGAQDGSTSLLVFNDIRRFGRLRVVRNGDYAAIPTLAAMGPEPFDPALDGDVLCERLRRSRRRLKTQLLSQRPIAGVGNIYADEALWIARINPMVTKLSPERAARLLEALRETLSQGIANGGTTFRDFRDTYGMRGNNQNLLRVYGREGLPCLRCDRMLVSATIDGRSTTWCKVCQRR